MEFLALIEKLEEIVTDAKRVPLSSDVRVDKQAAGALVSQLRGAIPDELREAYWISERRDEMLAEAKDEAARIVADAHEESARLLGEEALARAAKRHTKHVLEAAGESERELVLSAQRDASEILDYVETYLVTLAAAVTRGRERLAAPGPDRMIEADPDRLVARAGDQAVDAERTPA